MRTLALIGLATVLVAAPSSEAAAQGPIARPDKVTSFKRGSGEWNVTTTVWLRADGLDLQGLRFVITRLPALGVLTCDGKSGSGLIGQELVPDDIPSAYKCEFKPEVGLGGDDYLYYHAVAGPQKSQPAKIDIDIQSRGLRWEFIPAGSTGLSSDNPDTGALPDVLGKNAQDFIFMLNWVTDFPERKTEDQAGNKVPVSSKLTKSMSVTLQTGLATTPMTVEARDRGSATDETAPAPAADAQTKAGFRRAFTFSSQVDFSAVAKNDAVGSFVEIGATIKGAVDIATETDTIEIERNRLIQLLAKERGAYRVEAGVRFALKQDDEERSPTVLSKTVKDGQTGRMKTLVEPSRNARDLFVFEGLYQRDSGLAGLPVPDGKDSQNRWVIRLIGIPNIKGLPANIRPHLGLEVSRALAGGDEIYRLLYGANLSLR